MRRLSWRIIDMKILPSDDFWHYVKRYIPANTCFLYINHKYSTYDPLYSIYRFDGKHFCVVFGTDLKYKAKIQFDLMGFKIFHKFIIRQNGSNDMKVAYEVFQLSTEE